MKIKLDSAGSGPPNLDEVPNSKSSLSVPSPYNLRDIAQRILPQLIFDPSSVPFFIAITSSIFCFYPCLDKGNFKFKLDWLSHTIKASSFMRSVDAGISISIPLTMNLVFDLFSSNSSNHRRFYFSRFCHVSLLLFSCLLLDVYSIPSDDITLTWCILNARNSFGFCSFLMDLRSRGGPVWTNTVTVGLSLVWSIAQVMVSINSTLDFNSCSSYDIIIIIFSVFCIVAIWFLSFRWYRHHHFVNDENKIKNNSIHKDKISDFGVILHDDDSKLSDLYYYPVLFGVFTAATISLLVGFVLWSSSNREEDLTSLMTIYSFVFTACVMVPEVLVGRFTKMELNRTEVGGVWVLECGCRCRCMYVCRFCCAITHNLIWKGIYAKSDHILIHPVLLLISVNSIVLLLLLPSPASVTGQENVRPLHLPRDPHSSEHRVHGSAAIGERVPSA